MAILTGRWRAYGNPIGTQKYSPLDPSQIGLVDADRALCNWMLLNRRDLLTAAGYLPQTLRLATPGWAAVVTAETAQGILPPGGHLEQSRRLDQVRDRYRRRQAP
jgi:hypothetical protein